MQKNFFDAYYLAKDENSDTNLDGRTLSGSKSKVSSGRRIKRYSTGEEGGVPNGVTRTSSGAHNR